jgi:putative ABC transport system permease protein
MRRLIDRIRLRLRSLLQGEAVDVELRRELEEHLEEETEENIRLGLSPQDARTAALRAFGSTAAIAEACRDARRVSVMQNFAQDVRYTLRSLVEQPFLLAAATLSIAVAVGANTTIFNLANQLLLASPSASQPDRLVLIRMGHGSHVSYRQWQDLERSGALADLAGYQIEAEVNWRGAEQAVSLTPLLVTANYFDALGVPMAMGRGFTTREAQAERQPFVVVLSHGFWQRRLGRDPDVLGKTLTINGDAYTVLGVLPEGLRSFPGYGIAPEVYLPISPTVMPNLYDPDTATAQLVGRLKPGQTVGQGRAALTAAAQRLEPEYGKRFGELQQFSPVGGWSQSNDLRGVAAFVGVLLVAVGLVLAVACANVAGLLLSRGTVRRREIAIRVALGASRLRLIQQLLTEGLWIAVFGTLAGLMLMSVMTAALARITLPVPFPIELRAGFDLRLLLYSLAVIGVTTLFCGLAPAIQATRPSLVPALKQDEARYVHRRWTLRSLLVIGQVAVAIVLLLTASLFLRNLARATTVNPGFDVDHTVVGQLSFVEGRYTPASRAAFLDTAVRSLRSAAGIENAAYTQDVPLTIRSGITTGAELRHAERGTAFQARYEVNRVGPGYFATMGIAMEKGREFQASDRPGAPVVAIVNQEFARRYLPGVDPIGQHLLLPGAEDRSYSAEIVGVAGNSKHRTLGEAQQAAVYEAFLQRGNHLRVIQIVIRTKADPVQAVSDIQRTLLSMDSTAAVDVKTMRSMLAFAFLPSRLGAGLLGTLGTMGLLLAMVGLFAVISYSVSRRTAEIGIRMALGASRRAVLRLLLADAAMLVGSGVVIGLLVAYLITQPLAMFLVDGLSARDPISFIATTLVLCGVSLLATWQPARRALRVDPARALRE